MWFSYACRQSMVSCKCNSKISWKLALHRPFITKNNWSVFQVRFTFRNMKKTPSSTNKIEMLQIWFCFYFSFCWFDHIKMTTRHRNKCNSNNMMDNQPICFYKWIYSVLRAAGSWLRVCDIHAITILKSKTKTMLISQKAHWIYLIILVEKLFPRPESVTFDVKWTYFYNIHVCIVCPPGLIFLQHSLNRMNQQLTLKAFC